MSVTGTSRYRCRNCGKALEWNALYCTRACRTDALTQRYGHETLPGAVKFLFGYNCAHCGKVHDRRSQYCSNACKQAAYRQRHDPRSASWDRKRERSQRAARTKARDTRIIICKHCGQEARVTIAQSTNRRYCSNRCRQAAYRQRKGNQ